MAKEERRTDQANRTREEMDLMDVMDRRKILDSCIRRNDHWVMEWYMRMYISRRQTSSRPYR